MAYNDRCIILCVSTSNSMHVCKEEAILHIVCFIMYMMIIVSIYRKCMSMCSGHAGAGNTTMPRRTPWKPKQSTEHRAQAEGR